MVELAAGGTEGGGVVSAAEWWLLSLAVSCVVLASLLFGIGRLVDDRPRYKRTVSPRVDPTVNGGA